MFDFQHKAFEILNTFPDSDTKNSLEDLVKYTTERRK
jgi:octaprenyl-diphosphate synthase